MFMTIRLNGVARPKGADTRKQITQYLSEILRLEAGRNQRVKPTQSKIKTKSKPVDRSVQQAKLGNDIIKYMNDVYATSPRPLGRTQDLPLTVDAASLRNAGRRIRLD